MSQLPNEQIDQFSKQMEDKFMKDLENIEIGDSDSQLEASTDFYEGLKLKLNTQITSMRTSTTKNFILQQLKANINKQMDNVQKYEEEVKEMKFLNTAKQSAITQQKIQEIKNKIAKENFNQSKIVLADEQVELREKQQSRVIFQQVELEENQILSQEKDKQLILKKELKKKPTTANTQIQRKINQVNLERERISMEREDDMSMKYENFFLSQFFKDRFVDYKLPSIDQTKPTVVIRFNKPKSTFSNLAPLPNNQKNVLPKNSPQIALKSLKNNRKTFLMPVSQTSLKIEFKEVPSQLESPNVNMAHNQKVKTINGPKASQIRQLSGKKVDFAKLLSPYLDMIYQPLNQLQKISCGYKPKFIKNHLNEKQKISNIDISGNQGAERSLEHIVYDSQVEGQSDAKRLKQFKLTFEKVTNLKGIEKYLSIEYAALQFNLIKNLNQINQCKQLIQLNLSNNCIKQTKSIQNLPELRYLNLSSNKIQQFTFLGGSLQILNAKDNHIQIVFDLNKNRYLRIIDLTQNKLHKIGDGLSQLYFLQELNFQRNYIESQKGCQNLIMLQKLNLSHNRLQQISKPFIFMFLNTLDLSYNQLSQAPEMFLPSLQKFYVTNNKITGQNIGKTLIYLPELKQFNIDDNQIKGFSIIWFFIRYSRKLQIVKYDSNEYFLSVRQKVRQLYEAIIYRNMSNLKILNQIPFDSGIKAYYESVYSSYLKKGNKLQTVDDYIMRLQQFVSFLLKQNKMIANLQDQTSRRRNQRFTQKEVFIESKSIKRAQFLRKIVKLLGLNTIKTQKSQISSLNSKSSLGNKNQSSIISIDQHIYYHHDLFQSNLLKNVHKIKSLFYKIKYKNEKKRKYFQNKKIILIVLFKHIQNAVTQSELKKALRRFSQALKQNREESAAIRIQKTWRGYRSRKLFRKMLKKLRHNSDDSFQMEEVDLDEFQAHELPEFNFDLPDDVNFEEYIIEPKYFEVAADQAKKRNSKASNNLEVIEQKRQEYKPIMDNYMKQQQKKQQKAQTQQNDQKMMKQWGFQNPATLDALRWRKKRKEEMKKKQAEQNMTAAQRYQKFKMMHK